MRFPLFARNIKIMKNSPSEFKEAFIDRVYGHVDDSLIERYLEEYIYALELEESLAVWQQFNNVKDIIDDFKRFVEYAEECDLIEL